jgi:hypothetical protein
VLLSPSAYARAKHVHVQLRAGQGGEHVIDSSTGERAHSTTGKTTRGPVVVVAKVDLELLLHLHGMAILHVLLQPRPNQQLSQVSPSPRARPCGLRILQLLQLVCVSRRRRRGIVPHVYPCLGLLQRGRERAAAAVNDDVAPSTVVLITHGDELNAIARRAWSLEGDQTVTV